MLLFSFVVSKGPMLTRLRSAARATAGLQTRGLAAFTPAAAAAVDDMIFNNPVRQSYCASSSANPPISVVPPHATYTMLYHAATNHPPLCCYPPHQVAIFSKTTCPFCSSAKGLFDEVRRPAEPHSTALSRVMGVSG